MDFNTVLQIQVDGYPQRMKSHFVGREEGRYIILKIPSLLKNPAEILTKGKEVTVRYVHQGSVYGFRTPIVFVEFEPLNIFFVKFPRTIEDHNLRTHKRFECSLPARLEFLNQRHKNRKLQFRGFVGDISKGGCRATIKYDKQEWGDGPPQIQSIVEIYLALPGVEGELYLKGSLRSLIQDDCRLTLGVQFAELTGKSQAQLEKFLAINRIV